MSVFAPRRLRLAAVATVFALAAVTAAVVGPDPASAASAQIKASLGSTGWTVKAIQRKVGLKTTGRYDRTTASRVKRWQQAHDLRATGSTDTTTYAKMFPFVTRYHTGNQVIGYSLTGRPIHLQVVGSPAAKVKVLVVGCLHGNECAGVPILDKLAKSKLPQDTAYYLVRYPNPDGRAARTRGNARKVDLNRNFPGWRRNGKPGYIYYPGTKALSEPESRAVYRLMTNIKPEGLLTYHQALNVVDYGGGNKALQAAYAKQVRMRFTQLKRYAGSNATWAHAVFPKMLVLTIELPRPVTSGALTRHAQAAARLATAL